METMPTPEKQVRVFISSTFRDMHAERDHLVTVVFSELRERVEQLGLEFFDVDLRWGVPDKDVDGERRTEPVLIRLWTPTNCQGGFVAKSGSDGRCRQPFFWREMTMSMLCRIGMHRWKGCKCDACSKTRK